MRVVVTGAAGFIGSAITAALRSRGDDVVALDLMLDLAHGSADVPPDTHHLDVRDAGQWRELLRGADVVCHQAAVVGAGVRVADLPLYASHNDLGTAALLAAMTDVGVHRMVLASSMVVYGDGSYACAQHGAQPPGTRTPEQLEAGHFEVPCPQCASPLAWQLVPESARLEPRSAYAASKLAQENYASTWARQSGSQVVALRYHNVYGPGMPRDTPYAGVAAIFRSSLERGESPRVFEDGGQARDFVHVHDVARANLAALDAVRVNDRPFAAYNIASGSPITIGEVASLLARQTGIVPTVTGQYRLGDVRHVVASSELAREELGFSAQIPPHVGIPDFATAPLRE